MRKRMDLRRTLNYDGWQAAHLGGAMRNARDLSSVVAELARTLPSRQRFRAEVIELLGQYIGFDDAMFHCMDPNEPFERGHFVTEVRDWVSIEALDKWRTRYNPELAPLWNAAEKNGGVAVDTEILGPDSRNRLHFYREIAPYTGIEHFMWCHLVVHGARVSSV